MSFFPGKDPPLGDMRAADAIDLVIVPRSVDVGHFAVRRALPHVKRRMVGPFIFFDHFGPAEFHTGQGIDVRPHPHIGLATVTFLFDGEIMHRDSLGTAAAIRPGEVNWMTAGRGITVTAVGDAHLVLLGGAAMDGPRHIWWNFVSSRKERIAQAKADWKLARFDTVPGDDKEFIPLPET